MHPGVERVPPGRRANRELAAQFGVSEASIVKLTGIHERRLAEPEQATSDMALLAQAALTDAGMTAEGLIVS